MSDRATIRGKNVSLRDISVCVDDDGDAHICIKSEQVCVDLTEDQTDLLYDLLGDVLD